MQRISQIAARSVGLGPQQPGELPRQIIDLIWLRMTEIYGHKWTSSYGEADSDGTWAKCLADLGYEDLKRGFKACMTNGEPWPPSLPEFRAMCKPAHRENEAAYRIPPSHQLPKKLTDDERTKGRRNIQKLKATL